MKTKKIILAFAAVAILAIAGCASLHNKTAQNAPSDRDMICAELKRKMLFYRTDPNMNIEWNSPVKKARLTQQYQDLDCDNKLPASEIKSSS